VPLLLGHQPVAATCIASPGQFTAAAP